MSVTVLDAATRDAVALATTQPEQLDAIEAAFAGDITVRAMAGAVVAEVCTYGPWVRDSAEPRGMTLGALAASTVNVPDATITSFVFVEGSTPIFSIPAADASLDSPTTKTGRRTSLADAVLTKHRIIADASLPLGTATTYLLTFALADTATVDVAIAGSIVNTGTGACAWSITPPAHVSVTPSSGTLAAGGTQSLSVTIDTAGTYDLTLVSAGTTITGAAQNVVASLAPATSLTLSLPSTGTAGVAVDVTATPNGPVSGGGTATLSTTAGTLGSTTLTWADGESAAKTTTLELASSGSADVSLTTGMSLSISGSPASFVAATLALPAWVPAPGSGTAVNINLNTLHELNPCPANTCWYSQSSKNAAPWRNWNGAVLAPDFSAYGAIVFHGGGHGGGEEHGLYTFDFTTCLWSRIGPLPPATDYTDTVEASEYYDYLHEGSYIVPALHTYNYPSYIPAGSSGAGSKGAVLFPILVGAANSGDKPHMVDLGTGVWSRAATNFSTGYLGSSPYCGSIEDTTRNRVWWAGTGATSMRRLDLTESHPRTMQTHALGGGASFAFGGYYARHVYVPEADMAVGIWLSYGDTTPVRGEVFDMSSGVPVRTATLDSALPSFTITSWDGGPGAGFGMDWCPITQAFYLFEGPGATRVIKLTPSSLDFAYCTWTFSTESYTNSAVGLSMGTWGDPGAGSQPFSKWRWIDGLKCFCWSDGPTSSGVCRDGVTRTGLMQIWRPAGT